MRPDIIEIGLMDSGRKHFSLKYLNVFCIDTT